MCVWPRVHVHLFCECVCMHRAEGNTKIFGDSLVGWALCCLLILTSAAPTLAVLRLRFLKISLNQSPRNSPIHHASTHLAHSTQQCSKCDVLCTPLPPVPLHPGLSALGALHKLLVQDQKVLLFPQQECAEARPAGLGAPLQKSVRRDCG